MVKRPALVVAAVAVGAALGGLARAHRPVRIPIVSANPSVEVGLSGAQALVAVEMEPAAVLKNADGEALEYRLAVRPRQGGKRPITLRYSVEINDDEGKSLHAPLMPAMRNIAVGGDLVDTVPTPIAKKNGYFVMRTQVAAADGIEDTLQINEQYFKAEDGAITPITPHEYFESSQASVAQMENVKTGDER